MIWCDGALRDADSARLSVLDHGLTVGDGVFETLKATDGRAFALTRHLDRLASSARIMGLPAPDPDEVREACREVLRANPMPLGRLRITYTGGVAPPGSGRSAARPSLVVTLTETQRPAATTAVVTVPWTRNERSALAGAKSTSYAENVVALAHAHQHGAGEALFANTAGRLCEGTASNVFVVLDGELHTPPLSSGCLPGITRALVVEWSGAKETDLPFDVLEQADEIFLTSSLRDVQPVHAVDGRQRPGTPGPVTARALRTFTERAAADLDP
ncbi:4-amino-4-deoxychorismate lyase [Streptomyces mashuensis]|uniref:aminodeoxychorismate lyase n=2 Tax=Streptomyces mashuensis TaxID=33904 RepID=A0A919ECB0_9ACTN|nr:4-amino-4-deoxychorismate lyase [Streptomyces mashuensis]